MNGSYTDCQKTYYDEIMKIYRKMTNLGLKVLYILFPYKKKWEEKEKLQAVYYITKMIKESLKVTQLFLTILV